MRYSATLATLRALTFLTVTFFLLPLYVLSFPFGSKARRFFSHPFYQCCLFLTGISVRTTGTAIEKGGTLFVANHVSYLDIPVLAALTDGSFVAKSDVRDWPLFGLLAIVGRTIFVSRHTANLQQERLSIAGRLSAGECVFLFPEGSSSRGVSVLPFRTGLLSAACLNDETSTTIQPVSIVYGAQQPNRPGLTRAERDCYAWYGHMSLLPHLWRLFGTSERVTVTVAFHPSRQSDRFENRRALTRWAEQTVAQGMRQIYLSEVQAREAMPDSIPFLERDFSF